jgi:phosphoribosylformylglycinamidine (FGAM) synthase-like amidotransferase family enzyme
LNEDGNIGLGISNPAYPLVVSGLIFQVGERQMQMAGNENGDFEIKWLDVKEKESAPILRIHQPKDDPWKTNSIAIH